MDLVIYLIARSVMFMLYGNTNKRVESDGITPTAEVQIPIGSNLGLNRELGAYTRILKQFNLI